MKVLAAFYLIKFTPKNKQNIKEQLLQFINKAEGVLNKENKASFVLLISNISNLFYKNELRRESLALKKQSN